VAPPRETGPGRGCSMQQGRHLGDGPAV